MLWYRVSVIICAVVPTIVGPFLIWAYAPLILSHFWIGVPIGAIFLSCGFLAAVGVFEAVGERFSRMFNFNYGQARAWGSFGYAIMALVAGFTFVKNPHLNFWLGSVLGFILLLILIFWKSKEKFDIQRHIVEGDSDLVHPHPKWADYLMARCAVP